MGCRIHLPPALWTFDGNGITSAAYADVATIAAGTGFSVRAMAFDGDASEDASVVFAAPYAPLLRRPQLVLRGIYTGAGPASGVLVFTTALVSAVGGVALPGRTGETIRSEFSATRSQFTSLGCPVSSSGIAPGDTVMLRLTRLIDSVDTVDGADFNIIDAEIMW